jgi:uncharacterized membrane protein
MAKRLVTFDLLRGYAIILMVVFHVFLNVSDLVAKAGNLSEIGIGELILVAFIAIFIHWQSLFMMISATVHWYSMTKALEKGVKPLKILLKQEIFGVALYIFGFLREPFLSPWGITQDYFRNGGLLGGASWSFDKWYFIYRAETLSSIGFSIIIASLIFYGLTFITKSKMKEKMQVFLKVSILVIIAGVFIVTAPAVQNWANIYTGVTDLGTGEGYLRDNLDYHGGYYNRWFFNSIAGRDFPLFPNFSYFAAGCILGVFLTQTKPTIKMIRGFTLIGLVMTLGGAAYWLFIDDFLASLDVTFRIHPTGFVIFSIGLQWVLIMIFLRTFEFNKKLAANPAKMEKRLKRSRLVRRWGILALTIFVFNILEFVPRAYLTFVIDDPAIGNFRTGDTTLPWTLLCVVYLLLLWEVIIRLMEKLGGYLTIEWWFLVLVKGGLKKTNKKDPLNFQGILYDVEPVMFVGTE